MFLYILPQVLQRMYIGNGNFRFISLRFKSCSYSSRPNLKLNKALIVSKISKYEYERYLNPNLSKKELEHSLNQRGIDVALMEFYHNLHKQFEIRVVEVLQRKGIQVKVVNRLTFTEEALTWSDLVIPVGGDGTFLLAASLCRNTLRPFMGLNSHPLRSEGRLCLNKYYSENIEDAFNKLIKGDFRWLCRNRIRTTLEGVNVHSENCFPSFLHDYAQHNLQKESVDSDTKTKMQSNKPVVKRRVLPYLALNEVFIGENLSARVSLLRFQFDNSEVVTKTKSSGLCVCTGTGSSSWHLSINRISCQQIDGLLDILRKHSPESSIKETAQTLSEQYNEQLLFPPDDCRMCYSVREMIIAGVWPCPKGLKQRGFIKTASIASCCTDAGLVIDSNVCYPFNDGTKAILEIYPEDALYTINLE